LVLLSMISIEAVTSLRNLVRMQLTGRAGWRHVAAIDNLIPWTTPDCIDRDYSMWPAMLKTKGYYSSHVGKWVSTIQSAEIAPTVRAAAKRMPS
jgi:arylsulfatase A-like enzyme